MQLQDKLIDATPEKQLIRYNSKGNPEFGIRFIYQADNPNWFILEEEYF